MCSEGRLYEGRLPLCGDLLGHRSCQLPTGHRLPHAWRAPDERYTIEWIAGRVVGIGFTWFD